jgi:hypothetical protein
VTQCTRVLTWSVNAAHATLVNRNRRAAGVASLAELEMTTARNRNIGGSRGHHGIPLMLRSGGQ